MGEQYPWIEGKHGIMRCLHCGCFSTLLDGCALEIVMGTMQAFLRIHRRCAQPKGS